MAMVLARPEAACRQEHDHGNGEIFAHMVTREQIDAAVRILAEAARPARIVLFGSHARGDAREDSDVDFLVIAGTRWMRYVVALA